MMTRKQMKRYAKMVCECNLIHENPSSTEEEIKDAEKRLLKLTKYVMALHNGMQILVEIDELVQQLMNNNNKEID